jgi:hypothetical protein
MACQGIQTWHGMPATLTDGRKLFYTIFERS